MTTQQPTISRSSQEMDNVDDRLRQAILDKRQAQIQELSEKIDQLQHQAKQVAEGVRDETERKLAELRAARDAANSRLQELQRSTQDAWSGLLEQTDDALQSVSDRFHAFVNSQS
jgi:uncharacterized coiled-coil DUF342 family protein